MGAGRAKPGQHPPKTVGQGKSTPSFPGALPCAPTVRERTYVVMLDRPGLNPRAKTSGRTAVPPTVCKRTCVVMLDRPGLNPRAKFRKAPCGGSVWAEHRHKRAEMGAAAPLTRPDPYPFRPIPTRGRPLNRQSLIVTRYALGSSPFSQPLNRYSLIVNRYLMFWETPMGNLRSPPVLSTLSAETHPKKYIPP